MEPRRRLNWLANLAIVIEEACRQGVHEKEIEAAVKVGIKDYKKSKERATLQVKGLTDEVHPSEH